jgi:hypothetical protein
MTRVSFSFLLRALCLTAALVQHGVWLTQPSPLAGKILQLVLLAVAVARPANGLIVLAGLGPLGHNIESLLSLPTGPPHALEMMVGAVITGVLLRSRVDDEPSRTAALAVLMAAVGLASAATLMPSRLLIATTTDLTVWQHLTGLWRDGFGAVWLPAASAIVVAEGMALVWAAETIVRRDRAVAATVVAFLLIGCSAAGLLNLSRVIGAALRGGDFVHAAPALLLNARYNMFYDRNAAASMFALALLAGLALWRRPSWPRAIVGTLVATMAATLWLSGSRIAMLAVLITATGAAAFRAVPPGRRLKWAALGVVGAVVAAGVAYALLYPAGRSDIVSFSILGRLQMAGVALRMARAWPMFGAGIATFPDHSVAFGSPFGPENAHNNALQILAEEGAAGLAATAGLVGLVVVAAVRDEARAPSAVRFWLLAGGAGFGITAMTGHPLLVPEVALLLWMMLGVLAGLTTAPKGTTRSTHLAAAACLILAVSIPFRATPLRAAANLEYHGVNLSGWHVEPDDRRYRDAGATFALFLPADRTSIVPLRRTTSAPEPLQIQIRLGDATIATATLSGTDWHAVDLRVPNRGRAFERVDFAVAAPQLQQSSTATLVQVGKTDSR